jgi:hypothetical protein
MPKARKLSRDRVSSPPSGAGGSGVSVCTSCEEGIQSKFPDAVDLSVFRQDRGAPLSLRHKQWIVRQALVMLDENYVHLPMKRAMHAVDPVQRLKILRDRLDSVASEEDLQEELDEVGFHRALLEVFYSLRDSHTCYELPRFYDGKIAFLPFMVEDIYEDDRRKYIVSAIVPGCAHEGFAAGVEILDWNGMSIDRAVRNHAHQCMGSNPDARHSEALMSLTLRVLKQTPEPDHDWATVGYLTADDQREEKRFSWKVATLPREPVPTRRPATTHEMAKNPKLEVLKIMRRHLFARAKNEIKTKHDDVFSARPVMTARGKVGYLRIWSFELDDEEAFRDEFISLISKLPQNGLIIDVRENPGGRMTAAEYILQTLTPRRIEPQPVQFINTLLNQSLVNAKRPGKDLPDLTAWRSTIAEGLQTGAVYSAAYPKSDPQKCNNIGQKYFGPVVVIADALTYSAAEMFAAGFQDHRIGPVLGTDKRTGGGGANTWEYEKFRRYMLPDYRTLPNGVGFMTAIRRSLRVGPHAGALLEDYGVTRDQAHRMTRKDVLCSNDDLIERAASVLNGMFMVRSGPNRVTVELSRPELTSFEISVDDRPVRCAVKRDDKKAIVTFDRPRSSAGPFDIRAFEGALPTLRYRAALG